jgi:hypothetical protein
MRVGFSPIFWIVIVAVAVNGAVPGLVVCVESAGQVQIEPATIDCCADESTQARRDAGELFIASLATESGDSCGPCTDVPLEAAPVIRPASDEHACATVPAASVLTFDPATIRAGDYTARQVASTDLSFIPIKTTTLLI